MIIKLIYYLSHFSIASSVWGTSVSRKVISGQRDVISWRQARVNWIPWAETTSLFAFPVDRSGQQQQNNIVYLCQHWLPLPSCLPDTLFLNYTSLISSGLYPTGITWFVLFIVKQHCSQSNINSTGWALTPSSCTSSLNMRVSVVSGRGN